MRFILGLILGTVLGASLGLLVAPDEGNETRKALRDRMRHDPEEGDQPL